MQRGGPFEVALSLAPETLGPCARLESLYRRQVAGLGGRADLWALGWGQLARGWLCDYPLGLRECCYQSLVAAIWTEELPGSS